MGYWKDQYPKERDLARAEYAMTVHSKELRDQILTKIVGVEVPAGLHPKHIVALIGGRMLLFPDMTKEQHEADEFCFAAPCTHDEWLKLRSKATHDDKDYSPYVIREEDGEKIAIVLQDSDNDTDACLATAAYIRFVEKFTGMIYALPYTLCKPENSMSAIISRTAGVPTHQVRHVSIDD